MADERRNVVNRFGQVESVAAEDYERAIASDDYEPATDAQAAEAIKRAEYDTLGARAGALATGAASGASLGLTDVGIAELVPGGRELLQEQETYLPGTRDVGEIVGGVGALALGPGGGGSLLTRGARAISAPSRTAFRVGQAIEGAVGTTRAGRIGGLATGAAFEGGAAGAGQAISESAIWDTELTGERLATSVGVGALLGGGAGLGLGAAGRLLRGAGEGASGLINRAFRTAEGDPSRFARLLGASSEALSGAPPGSVTRFLTDEEYLRKAAQAGGRDGLIEAETRQLVDDLERFHNANERFRRLYSGDLKLDEVARRLPKGNAEAQRQAARALLDEFEERVATMKADDAIANKGLKKAQQNLAATRRLVDDGADPAKVFDALDDFKRAVGDAAYNKIGAGKGGPAEKALYRQMDDIYERTRGVLENGALWGEAADMQRAVNAAWAPYIQTSNATGMGRLLAKQVRGFKGASERVFQREGVSKAFTGVGSQAKQQLLENADAFLEHGARFAREAKGNRSLLSAADSALADDMAGSADKLRERIARLKELEKAHADLLSLKELDAQGQLASGAVGYAIGSGILGPGTALAGTMYGAVRSPYGLVTKLDAVRRLAEAADRRMVGATTDVMKMAVGTKRLVEPATDHDGPGKDAADKGAKLEAATADTAAARARMEDELAGLGDHAPQTATAALDAAQRAGDYLLRTMPAGYQSQDGRRRPPPRQEARVWLQRMAAIEDPSSLVRDVAGGRLSPAALEAIRETMPGTYRQLQQDAAAEVAKLHERGQRLPYAQRVRLGAMLQLPIDGTLDAGLLSIIHGAYAMTAEMQQERSESQGGPVQVPDLADAYRTDSERLAKDSEAA